MCKCCLENVLKLRGVLTVQKSFVCKTNITVSHHHRKNLIHHILISTVVTRYRILKIVAYLLLLTKQHENIYLVYTNMKIQTRILSMLLRSNNSVRDIATWE